MKTIERLRSFTQSCLDLAQDYPEPYRTQALAVIGKKQNWPAKLEKLNLKLVKEFQKLYILKISIH